LDFPEAGSPIGYEDTLAAPQVDDKLVETKTVSVGAGARIRQDLVQDLTGVDDWQPTESGIIRLYFVFQPQFEQIVREGGVKDLTGSVEGFLKDMPVG
jgi:hypothetical protein